MQCTLGSICNELSNKEIKIKESVFLNHQSGVTDLKKYLTTGCNDPKCTAMHYFSNPFKGGENFKLFFEKTNGYEKILHRERAGRRWAEN